MTVKTIEAVMGNTFMVSPLVVVTCGVFTRYNVSEISQLHLFFRFNDARQHDIGRSPCL